MAYEFDQVIDRRNTGSSKWDSLQGRFGRADVLPMWVADMDFASPPSVQDALRRRANHGVYGYPIRTDAYRQSIVDWMRNRHDWTIDPAWIAPAPGVVPALTVIVQAFTKPGDGVLIQPPVYHPFKRVIEGWNRRVVANPLIEREGRYEVDFDDLERKAKDAKVMFLCSPHNPVGRVWTKEELVRIGEICLRHQVLVVADEIHEDIVFKPHRHIPFASLNSEFSLGSITCAAPSKTFNLAGLNTAYIVAEDKSIRDAYESMSHQASMGGLNVFGMEAMIAAYREGGPWLDELIQYLSENLDYLTEFVAREIPGIRVIRPEGTYLAWLDFRALKMDAAALDQFLVHEAGIALNEGHIFGDEGNGFQRINIACPRSLLEQGLTQLREALSRVK